MTEHAPDGSDARHDPVHGRDQVGCETVLYGDDGDRCPECGLIVTGIRTVGAGEHVLEPCGHPATLSVRQAVLRRSLPDGVPSLAVRIDTYLQALREVAAGEPSPVWPDVERARLERDHEAFRGVFGIDAQDPDRGAPPAGGGGPPGERVADRGEQS